MGCEDRVVAGVELRRPTRLGVVVCAAQGHTADRSAGEIGVLQIDTDQAGVCEVCVGEVGRTPQISPLAGQSVPGRHHWAPAYTAIFAGARILEGQVIGKTDGIGAYPVTIPFHPNDLGATIYSYLGIDPESTLSDRLDRPRPLNRGKVMDVLTTGVTT